LKRYLVTSTLQDSGLSYQPGELVELDDAAAKLHADNGAIDLDSAENISDAAQELPPESLPPEDAEREF
jgi:hypothetical protein